VLKAAAETTYINDILPDGKGTVLISLGDTQGLFWYKNGKLLELWSPGGKIIAYLKQDKKEPPIDLGGDGRAGMGHQLAVYDLGKQQVIKEWTGKKLFNSRPIWSPNGEYLLCNMVESLEDNTELKEEPYLINIKTGEVRKITSETYRKRNWALRFLSLLTWIQLS
jgi:Tol biopolymer transport system component